MSADKNYLIMLAEKKAAQLGITEFEISQKEITLDAGEIKTIPAHNEYFFLADAPFGLSISSDFGEYNKENPAIKNHTMVHSGEMVLTNHTNSDMNVSFIHLVLIN